MTTSPNLASSPVAASSFRSLDQLPGPPGLPLLGNVLQLDTTRFHTILEAWSAQYGSLYTFKFASRPALVIAEPELIRQALRSRPETYRRAGAMAPVFKEMGIHGVFSAEGDEWRRLRRLVMQALDQAHLRQFYPTLTTVTDRLHRVWSRAAHTGQAVDAQQDLMRYTVDVTTSLVFGYDMNTLEQAGDVIQDDLEKIFPMVTQRVNSLFPYWRYLKLPQDHAVDRALAAIRQRADEFIAHTRGRLASDPSLADHPSNLLEAMLVARDDSAAGFSGEELYGNIITLLLAGEDTTANTIAWMLYFMAEHPEVQRQMQAEADAVMGDAMVITDMKLTEKLAYIEAVAQETMRLKPVAPIIYLQANAEVDLGDVRVPRGALVCLLTRPAGLHEEHFTRATEFQPSRWLADRAAYPVHNREAYVPFGAGPRMCPGRNLAFLEMKTAVAMVSRAFTVLRIETDGPVGEGFAFTMMPTNLRLKLSPRVTIQNERRLTAA